jgi:organic radical activating enzyme
MKRYPIAEVFASIQGEGARAGTFNVFLRFAGCNLKCGFCDTDHRVKRRMTLSEIVSAVSEAWISGGGPPRVQRNLILTGGEPLLHLDEALWRILFVNGWNIAVETNGAIQLPPGVFIGGHAWLTVSPKAGAPHLLREGDELKVVLGPHPSATWDEDALLYLADKFRYRYVQVMWNKRGPNVRSLQMCLSFVARHPEWRLSVQTHKLIGVP